MVRLTCFLTGGTLTGQTAVPIQRRSFGHSKGPDLTESVTFGQFGLFGHSGDAVRKLERLNARARAVLVPGIPAGSTAPRAAAARCGGGLALHDPRRPRAPQRAVALIGRGELVAPIAALFGGQRNPLLCGPRGYRVTGAAIPSPMPFPGANGRGGELVQRPARRRRARNPFGFEIRGDRAPHWPPKTQNFGPRT